jgi:protein CpxP
MGRFVYEGFTAGRCLSDDSSDDGTVSLVALNPQETSTSKQKESETMKLRSKIITATLMLISLFAIAAVAKQGPGHHGPHGGGPLHALGLTDAQKEQAKAIHEAERAKIEPYLKQLEEARTALKEATAKGQFDETKVRAIAATQSAAQIELTVSRARTEAAVYKILTPEQQAKVEKLHAEHNPEGGHDFGRHHQ